MSTAWRTGSTRAWRKRRADVLAENLRTNAGRCVLAVKGVCTLRADTVHHVRGRAATGDDPRWLVASCGPCNRHVAEPAQHPASCHCGWGLKQRASSTSPRPRRVSRW